MSFGTAVFIAMLLYVAFMLFLALKVERTPALRNAVTSSPYVYSLALSIYMTAWTFYGNVGQAAQSGLDYLLTFTGSFFGSVAWWWVLRRIVRVKNRLKITSISDFISSRYGKSHLVAGLVASVFFVGSLPYVAIQFKAILATLDIVLAFEAGQGGQYAHSSVVGPFIVLFTIVFTILAGVRHLDPTERHPGVVSVIAVEALVKLVAFGAVGIFVTYGLFDGFEDVFSKAIAAGYGNLFSVGGEHFSRMDWFFRVLVFAPAILLLPRQFHVAVIENSNENHIRTAMWMLPLNMLLMSLFVMPLALAGLLMGLEASKGDLFVLLLPLREGHFGLATLVFLGGFSAGLSMIVVTTMTMATMISNDLLLPVFGLSQRMNWLRRYILQCRWVVVCVYLGASYVLYLLVGGSNTLVSLGIISMIAAIQLVPATLGALYWPQGNRAGVISGLTIGFFMWGYTLILPVFVKSGLIGGMILQNGPWGIGWLRPERLFGLDVFDPLSHTVFWSLGLNVLCYVIGSCLWSPAERDIVSARDFSAFRDFDRGVLADDSEFAKNISVSGKKDTLVALFSQYYPENFAESLVESLFKAVGFDERQSVTVVELATLASETEKRLAGVVGSASASKLIRSSGLFSEAERSELARAYKIMLANMDISPEELLRRLDFHREREHLLEAHANELGKANALLRNEMAEREKAQQELVVAEEKYRSIFENAVEGIFQTLPQGKIAHANPALLRMLGYDSLDELISSIRSLREDLYVDGEDRDRFVRLLSSDGEVSRFETRLYRKDGSKIWVALHSRAIFDESGQMVRIEGIAEDISERKRAEEEMYRATRFVRNIIDAMPSVMIAVSNDMAVAHWNREAEHRYGINKDMAIGKAFLELLPWLYPLEETIHAALATGEIQHLPRLNEELRGELFILDVVVYPIEALDTSTQVVLRLDDATSRVRLEEVMVQTEKMMSVGGLAAGMAHEINNPLGAILLGVQNVTRRLDPERKANRDVAERMELSLERMQEYLAERKVLDLLHGVRSSGERAANIVSNMLEFSRRSETRFSPVNISELLDKAVELAWNDYDLKKKYDFRQMDVVREYAPNLPEVHCNGMEIEQVVLNLLRNAAQAMYQEGYEPDEKPRIILRTAQEADRVRIEVEDNGPGMDESVRKRVFEPFFTTKPVGVGTGLGLSVSYFIITSNHSGQFFVDTRKGQGTTFTIILPIGVPVQPDIISEAS
ncbi:PAS domain S-box protein [Desulfovibrio mangrovi]|uniref:PAS domain S-box protein n=1 Tax=Desulfovibrio mangrovi TaxID=2976983 RepID=UPI0022465CEF|nr:PAS domain S-box protein [Desulfovibrio mangrovi]UZP68397.1 PAS domain S-box protein [Desulfovibrio mangrovi]